MRSIRRAAITLSALALVVSGCAAQDTDEPEAPETIATADPATPTETEAPDETVELPDDIGAALTPVIESTMDDMLTPGAVVLVRGPGTEWIEAFGTRVAGEDDPVTVDDHFRIGSNTKTMTGTVVLQLVDEGEIGLDDPVSDYRDDVPNGENITIRQILDMRSGLYSYSELESFNQTLDDDPARVWDPEELLALGLAEDPYFPPGEGYHYSNTNTVLAGLIVEQITEQPLEEVLEERIFSELDLADTRFPAITDVSIPDPHPRGYLFGTNVSTLESPRLTDDEIAAAQAGELLPNDVTDMNPSWGWAAGAGISTAQDLADYVEALVGSDTFLTPGLQSERLASIEPVDPDNPASPGYGLALAQFSHMLGHDGSLPGFQSFMGYDPDNQITLIVLCNLQDGPEGQGGTANELARAIMGELYPAR
ncbi:beta-lactamase family protein [Hoyosella sp. YIM 151337]|uniref:serine hydrolase domain-containing protein n=1 Tax=Hoyosella sp. YIM 151337 TaxID=2992742 RepID=UPI0022367412|nr:serine hydrolase domain-containing protein [Hoyosella sp. YIM 151337]MCW4354280.1 beta-lactamase family protein [Hoyosella sp. YIM 151337]